MHYKKIGDEENLGVVENHFLLSEEEFVYEMACALSRELKKLVYPHIFFEKLKSLNSVSEKLVFMFIWICQPQCFTSVRRCLCIPGNTVALAVKKLRALKIIVQDENFLFWVEKDE